MDVSGAEIGSLDGDTETGLAGKGEIVNGVMRVVILYADSSRVRRRWRSSKTEDEGSADARMASRATTLCAAVVIPVVASASRTLASTLPTTSIERAVERGDEMETTLRSPLLFFLTFVEGCSSSGGGDPGRRGGSSLSHSSVLKTNKRTITFFCPGCLFASAVTVAASARWVWYSSEGASFSPSFFLRR